MDNQSTEYKIKKYESKMRNCTSENQKQQYAKKLANYRKQLDGSFANSHMSTSDADSLNSSEKIESSESMQAG